MFAYLNKILYALYLELAGKDEIRFLQQNNLYHY